MAKIKEIRFVYFILLFIHFYQIAVSIEATCRPKRFDESCRSDEDCYGPTDQCIRGRCTCALNFDRYTINEKMRICRPAMNKFNDTCETACKEPLVCSQGKCICWKGQTINGQCVVTCPASTTLINQMCHTVSKVIGGLCSSDDDCAIANSYCERGRCQCILGSVKQGSSSCLLSCPDGNYATQTCSKLLANDPMSLANSEKMDSCPKGYYCATYGKPNIGHCCKLYCPYGNADLNKNCNGAGTACTSTGTHYCETFHDHGTRNSLCCPRPCREPTPLFINNRCYPKAHRDDACVYDGQCEGGIAMKCTNGQCTCRPGYVNENNENFPTCKKKCLLATYVDGQCYRRVGMGEPCLASSMCPKRSVCREGLCVCDCNSALSANKCINPDDPMGTTPILDAITGLLGGKSRR